MSLKAMHDEAQRLNAVNFLCSLCGNQGPPKGSACNPCPYASNWKAVTDYRRLPFWKRWYAEWRWGKI